MVTSPSDSERLAPDWPTVRTQLEQLFAGCDDIEMTTFRFAPDGPEEALLLSCPPLTQGLDHNLMRTAIDSLLPQAEARAPGERRPALIAFFDARGPAQRQYDLLETLPAIADAVLAGRTVLLLQGWPRAAGFESRHIAHRQIEEPATEAIINGPREGMVEDLDQNIALLRARLKTPRFKLEFHTVGELTKARTLIGYVAGSVDEPALAELKRRLKRADKIELLDTTALRELIEDNLYSPFPQYRVTERPDVAVSAVMEGKIIVMAEGTGTILICPTLFTDLFQSAEDYYQRTVIATLVRFLRIGAFFIALTLPALYIALSDFHPELIPTNLLLTVLDSREGIPFPALLEALMMQFFFELLREAGIRLPRPIGAAVSIVGALIIGEASIRAGVASPIMTVVIALTGIASFSIPQYELATALRILVFPMMLLAYALGGYGLMIGYIFMFLHLTTLRVLGRPYLSPLAPLHPRLLLDVLLRAPLRLRLRAARRQRGGVRP
ncbi:spore germination protein [Paenibacillus sp. IB182496]|uniref:Spore germination protein n=1 Tax=Paenibacillus sabuli TaxID=2772509 RepID=A0A927GRS5_9BACL|nr:spore germination protein [Paenibacillus sabuli]MBD2844982.1 spore germination protein [Paenibacillus sabuli]